MPLNTVVITVIMNDHDGQSASGEVRNVAMKQMIVSRFEPAAINEILTWELLCLEDLYFKKYPF